MAHKASIGLLAFLFIAPATWGGEDKPKYGPKDHPRAVPLALENQYFREEKAPHFWALISHYIPQFRGSSCSSASVAMVLNAARAHQPKTTEDKVISEPELLDKVDVEQWKKRLGPGGCEGKYGVDLTRLTTIVRSALKAYGFKDAEVQPVHLDEVTKESKQALVQALERLSMKHFIIANFDQKVFTDDTTVGHFSPIGAYDSKRKKVLILDSDREYYEPYWVDMDTLIAGMATLDPSAKKKRGYLVIRLKDK